MPGCPPRTAHWLPQSRLRAGSRKLGSEKARWAECGSCGRAGTPPGALQTVTSPGLRGEARVCARRQLMDVRCGGGGSKLGHGEPGGGLCTQGDCSLMNLDCLGSRKEVSVAELGQDALEDLVLTRKVTGSRRGL